MPIGVRAVQIGDTTLNITNNNDYTDMTALKDGGDNARLRFLIAENINGLATGQTTLYAAQTGKRFMAIHAYALLRTITGAGTVPSIRIGVTATFDGLVPITALTGLTTANNLLALPLVSTLAAISINTNPLKVDVQMAATLYDAYTFDVVVIGMEVDV